MKRTKAFLTIAIAMFLGLVLLLIPISTLISLAQVAITWTKYYDNPVLEGDLGQWDEGGVGAACVIEDGSAYKMWYTGLTPGLPPVPAIGYAYSTDGGKTWTKDTANNPVLTKGTSGTWDDEGVGSSCVIWDADDGLYKMWYTGTPDNTSSAIPAIGYAEYDDINGVWVKDGSNPVLEGGSAAWDAAGVLSPCVIKESTTSYKMWYTGRAADGTIGSLQIGYATSTDGKTWIDRQKVLPKGTSGAWDEQGVGVGSVVKISGKYEMWYTGYKGYGKADIEVAIGYASSNDGILWAKSDFNPVLTKGTGWEINGVGAPWVIYSGGTYHMWYSGLDTNFDPALGYAYSTWQITGTTGEVKSDILPEVTVELYKAGDLKASTVSDGSGNYALPVPEVGDYEVVASKTGFKDETQSISITDPGVYTLDFRGEHGLVPKAPNMSYVLACINAWLYPQPPFGLSMSKVLAVINAWLYPT